MVMQLKQARDSIQRIIDENPTIVTYKRAAMVSDGMGGTIPDPFGAKTTSSARVRLSYESGGAQVAQGSPAGISANLSKFLTMNYLVPIKTGDVITDESGQGWTVGAINIDRRFGGVVGGTAALTKADAIPGGA